MPRNKYFTQHRPYEAKGEASIILWAPIPILYIIRGGFRYCRSDSVLSYYFAEMKDENGFDQQFALAAQNKSHAMNKG
jgi:hypothetical protein